MKNTHKYPPNWSEISQDIREAQGQRCQRCKVRNGSTILRGMDAGIHKGTFIVLPDDGSGDDYTVQPIFSDATGVNLGSVRRGLYRGERRPIRVILTVAHLDHNESNNDRTNLAALCQACHLRHDAADNARRRKYGIDHGQQQTLFD